MTISFPDTIINLPSLAGQLAKPKQFFGDHSRYAIAPVHSRFDGIKWFIWDSQVIDQVTGLPDVIFQYDNLADALYMVERIEAEEDAAAEQRSEEEEVEQIQSAFTLTLRKTRTYVDAYRHLDQEVVVGTAVVLQSSSKVTDEADMCEPTRIIKLIEIKDHVQGDHPTILQAIRDTMTHVGCGHDYDCCGCWSTRVHKVVHVEGKQFIVIQHSSRNY